MASVKPNYNKQGEIISYRFRACIGRDEMGKQEFVSKTVNPPSVRLTPTKELKQMQTDADTWEREVKKGNAPVQQFTFKYFIQNEFIPVFVYNGKHSPTTIKFYKDKCEKLVEYFGNKKLDSIRSIDIDKFISDLSKETYKKGKEETEHHYSTAFIGHHRTVLTSAFNFAERHGMIVKNPMRFSTPVKKERIEVDFLPKQEAKGFRIALNEHASVFWKAAMNMLAYKGLRRSELAGLQWKDIDFDNHTLSIKRNVINNKETGGKNYIKETKSEKSYRILPIPTDLMCILKAWKTEQENTYGRLFPNAFIFGSALNVYEPIRPDSFTRWLDRFCKTYGTVYGFHKVSPHDLRHTVGTLMSQNKVPVKDIQNTLGHSDPSTTIKYYCGSNLESLTTASDSLAETLAMGE